VRGCRGRGARRRWVQKGEGDWSGGLRRRGRAHGNAGRGRGCPRGHGARRDRRHRPDRGAASDRSPPRGGWADRRDPDPRGAGGRPGDAALQGGRRAAQGPGRPARGAARSRPAGPGARQGAGAAERLVGSRPGKGRSRSAQRAGAVRPAAHPARPYHRAGALRRRCGTALRQPRRLRHEQHEAPVAAHGESAARRVPGTGAIRARLEAGTGRFVPRRRHHGPDRWTSWTRWSSCRAGPSW